MYLGEINVACELDIILGNMNIVNKSLSREQEVNFLLDLSTFPSINGGGGRGILT